MLDYIIVGGFSGFNTKQSYAEESPFLLFRNGVFGDIPGLYKCFVEPELDFRVTDYDTPPFVCYVLKKMLHDKGLEGEMVFYLDQEEERMGAIFGQPHQLIVLSTTFLYEKEKVREAVKAIRRWAPDSIIVCGGVLIDRSWEIRGRLFGEKNPLFGPCKEDYFFIQNTPEDECGVDLFIYSDPELNVLAEVLKRIKKREKVTDLVDSLPNLAVFKEGYWKFSKTMSIQQPIMPVIDWSIFRSDEIRATVPMIRSKGCPFKCQFCHFRSLSKIKEKGLDILDKEIQGLLKHHDKVQFIAFSDDNIGCTRKSILELMKYFEECNYPLAWSSMLDARYIDDGFAEKLRKAKCAFLKIGMESGDDTILENMKKPCRKKDYIRSVKALSQAGVSIDAYFIVGFPGETPDTIRNTIETINSFDIPKHSINESIFFPFVLFPLISVFEKEQRDKYQVTGYKQRWKHATMDFETAVSHVPQIVKQINTMPPMHGNMDMLLVKRRDIMAQVDQTRGDLIRHRLKTGQEDPAHWAKLESLVKQLTLRKDAKSGLIEFV